jgi:hypothetical protein
MQSIGPSIPGNPQALLCQHAQCGGELLDCAMAKISGTILPLLEESIILHHTLHCAQTI